MTVAGVYDIVWFCRDLRGLLGLWDLNLIEDHQSVSEPIIEHRLVFQSHFFVVLKAQFFDLFDNVFVGVGIDVLVSALAWYGPTHEDSQFGMSCQVADEGIL